MTWGIRNKYLIVGVGEGRRGRHVETRQGEPPAWLAAIRKQLPVERPSTLIYFNVKQTVAQFSPLGGPKVKAVLDAVGLGNVSYLASVTGLDNKGAVARTLVAIDGQPQGIFRLAAAKPLTAADLAPIPRDATIAAAGRLDANTTLELLLAQLEKIDPAARQNATQGIAEMEKELGIDLQGGPAQAAGRRVVRLQFARRRRSFGDRPDGRGAGQGPRSPGSDAQQTDGALPRPRGATAAAGKRRQPSHAASPRIVKTDFAGQAIYDFDIPDHDFPLAPAWCLTEKELIVSTFPQNIKSYLLRGKDFQSLAAVPDVARGAGEAARWR